MGTGLERSDGFSWKCIYAQGYLTLQTSPARSEIPSVELRPQSPTGYHTGFPFTSFGDLCTGCILAGHLGQCILDEPLATCPGLVFLLTYSLCMLKRRMSKTSGNICITVNF